MLGKRFFIKNLLQFLFLITIAFSCSSEEQKVIHYTYKGSAISRIDEEKKTFLYFGYCNDIRSIKEKGDVVIDWQFDDFLMASMIFHDEGKVELINGGGGSFKKNGLKSNIFFKEYSPQKYTEVMSNFMAPNSYKNLYILSDNLQAEIKKNNAHQSYIKVKYELSNERSCR